MADDTHAQNDPQVDDAPAEPPLTDIENPLVDDDSPEARLVRERGFGIAREGDRVPL